MPEISRFFGIVITMYYHDHEPPHFHAPSGGQKAVYAIDSLEVLFGVLPPRAHGLVLEWADASRQALRADWDLARRQQLLTAIPPLE